MENKVFEENLNIIKKYDSNLANKILMFNCEKTNLSITQTQQGEYNLVYKGFCLHSQQGAVEEAKKIADKINDEQNSIRVIFGLGLGYVVDETASKIHNSKIIIYEPELEIINYVLKIAKIDALYKNNVVLCNDKELLAKYVLENTDKDSKMKLIYTKTYKELFKDEFDEITQVIQKAQGQHSANLNTIINKSPCALLNTYSNLPKIFNLPYIEQFRDIFKNKTALIISAGPSLRENIETIKKNQDKFIIFCVNAAMELVINSGIRVDFIVDIETAGKNYQYSNLDLSDTYLILEAFSNNEKYKVKTKNTITYISQNNFINGWVRQLLNLNDNLETMGTVSYTALDCAYIMGFSQIILIGQDLAFKNGECYAKGSIYEDLECIFDETKNKYIIKAKDFEKYTLKLMGSSTETAKKNTQKYIDNLNKNIYTVKSQDGSYIPTQTGYALFVEWFERAAIRYKKEKPQIRLINSSTGGAQIEGFENIRLDEIFNKTADEISEIEKISDKLNNIKKIAFDKAFVTQKVQKHTKDIEIYHDLGFEVQKQCEKFLNELKIKKVLTPNALKLMKKHNDALNNLLNYNQNQDLRLLTVRFEYQILPLIEKNFTKDIQSIKETFEKLNEIYKKIIQVSNTYIKKLKEFENTLDS